MSMNDPIADMLTRIRNANAICHPDVTMPSSSLKVAIADALKREGFIDNYKVVESTPANLLKIYLKYGKHREKVIRKIEKVSKGGRRVYTEIADLKPVLNGLGVAILSTSKGVLSDREARKLNVGGEIICRVW
ncbi:MAG: 30S ribosomal protein S8 [Planctomycetota bacterium]